MSYQPYTRYNPNRSNRWQDWVNLVLAIWFFFSPWILQFGNSVATTEPAATAVAVNAVSDAAWNAWVLSVIVFLIALSAIGRMELWQEWINLLLGVWIFVAPWALGFSSGPYPDAAWDHWVVGALIVIVSATSLANSRSAVSVQRREGDPYRR